MGFMILLFLVVGRVGGEEAESHVSGWNIFDTWFVQEVATDSVVWKLETVNRLGDSTCAHKWVKGKTYRAGGVWGCTVLHAGLHCSYDDQARPQVCRTCGRNETWREQWYQHVVVRPKTEYEVIEDSVGSKRKTR